MDSRYIYQNVTYGDFKDLPRREPFDKVIHDKTLNIAENLKYDAQNRGLASMLFILFDKILLLILLVVLLKLKLCQKDTLLC